MNGDATEMDRFKRMPKRERNEIYGELYEILKPLKNDYFGSAEHAFHNEHGQSSTLQQKAQAIQNHLARKIAKLFEGDEHDHEIAMERFLRLPEAMRGTIYGELYEILKPLKNDYFGCAEHAFHNKHGQSSTSQQKAQAIRNYFDRGY